jgi:enoyl-CoA hydratase/carnithine racemase
VETEGSEPTDPYADYRLLKVERRAGVAQARIDAPPVNVMTAPLFGELLRFGQQVGDDDEVRVVVLSSADPDFFIAHFDVEVILGFPTDEPAERSPDNVFHRMCERYRTMPKVTIARIEGRVGGGGSELVQAFDMRFGVRGRTIFNQMEVPIGILPGGGGTQRLPRLIGRGRALEMILGGIDVDAELAERWGLLNRAFEPEEIGPRVDALAARIASFPPEAVRLAKRAVDAAALPLAEGLVEEDYLFQRLIRTDDAQVAMRRFLERGGQTRDVELRVDEVAIEIARSLRGVPPARD